MKTILFVILSLFVTIVRGQHYYNDIKSAQALSDRMKNYVSNKVTLVTATGYDENGVKSRDFNEWQYVQADKYVLRIVTRNGQLIARQRYQFDGNYRLLSITDSSNQIRTKTDYSYDANNHIISVKVSTTDSLSEFTEVKENLWKYNAAGKPEKMWRLTNGKDSLEYRFSTDDNGNITDEKRYRGGTAVELLYYYYDEQNRLTDIVRYDKSVEQLLPEQIFDYDENNNVIQRTNLLSLVWRDFLIWRFIFNEKGLKTKEALFSKAKDETGRNVLKGRIDYTYSFAP